MTHPVSQYSAPPLLAPGCWRLSAAWVPWPAARRLVRVAAVLLTALMVAWAAAWAHDIWRTGEAGAPHLAALVFAAIWFAVAGRTLTRPRRGPAAVVLAWHPVGRGGGVWSLKGLDDAAHANAWPVRAERVLQCLGWRLYRLSSVPGPDASGALLPPREPVWCWVPPLPERDDPADMHRLSCLLTFHHAAFGTLAQSMASSRHDIQQGSDLTSPPDTDFPDTVCLPERPGRSGRRRAA